MKFLFLSLVCIILFTACHFNSSQTVSATTTDSTHPSPSVQPNSSKPLSLNLTTFDNSAVTPDSNLSNDGIIFHLTDSACGEIISLYDGGAVISLDDSIIWFKEDTTASKDSSVAHYRNENYELTTNLASLKKDTTVVDSNNILLPVVGTMMLKAKDGRTIVRKITGTIIQ
jgi:hypothetical protein